MSNEAKMHEMLTKFKDLAIRLGKTPTTTDCDQNGLSNSTVRRYFGGHTQLIHASGLEQNKPGGKIKIDNSVFNRNIEDHLDKFTQESDELKPIEVESDNWCVLNDIHWPFHHAEKMELFHKRHEKKKYDLVILNGDARDFFSHTKFTRTHNQFTPREENALGRKLNEEFWQRVKKVNPKARCFQTMGNHDARPLKRILESYPAAEDWVEEAIKREFSFDGVTTLFDYRDYLLVNKDIAVMHGYKAKLGDHRDQHLMSCVVGHTHRPGIVYRRMGNKIIFEANSGYMGNPAAKGLTYTQSKHTEWVNSFLEGDDAGARIIVL